MENTEPNKQNNILLDPERAKAWIFTLVLGVAVCLALIIYTLITHNILINLENSFCKPGLVWLGFIGWIFSCLSYFLFWISTSLLKYLPENKRWIKITAISGIFLLLSTFISLLISYDIENRWFDYLGYNLIVTGTSMTFTKELIQHKFPQIANIWNSVQIIIMFIGLILLICSFDT